VIFLLLVLK
jgi:hypothetical protein